MNWLFYYFFISENKRFFWKMTDYRNTGNYNDSQPYVVGILSPSTTLYIDQAPSTRDTVPPNDLNLRRRNTNSFQITSVTVQGSRKNDDIADDSADDLDESHTDDLSSDFLDSSRADNEVSPEDSNPICDDLSPCGPIIFAQLPTSVRDPNMNLSLGVTPTFTAIGPNVVAGGVTMMTSKSESPISAQVPIMNPLPDNWQRRFKVVKIVSSEPFRRGRWLCMDFKDPPATEPSDLKNENNGTNTPPTIQITNYDADFNQGDMFGMENYAHVYEIPINQTFNGNFVMGNQQQMYGIILPQSNHVQPVTLVQDLSLQTTATDRNFNNIVNNQNILVHAIPPHVPEPVVPPPAPFSQRAPSPVPTLINNCIPNQSPPSSQSANDYNVSSQPVLNHIKAVTKVNQEIIVSRSRTNSESNSIVKQLAEKVPVRIDPSAVEPADTESFSYLDNELSRTSGLLPRRAPPTDFGANGHCCSPPLQPKMASTVKMAPTKPAVVVPPPSVIATTAAAPCAVKVPRVVADINSSQTAPEKIPSAEVEREVDPSAGSATSTGANTVAIDNKIEQAMDLVKSHLMFAVREEVEVLKEKITELLERISQLEHENDILRANASAETLKQLNNQKKTSGGGTTGKPQPVAAVPPPST